MPRRREVDLESLLDKALRKIDRDIDNGKAPAVALVNLASALEKAIERKGQEAEEDDGPAVDVLDVIAGSSSGAAAKRRLLRQEIRKTEQRLAELRGAEKELGG